MAAKKKDFSLVVWVFGWLLSLIVAISKIVKNRKVPFEAFEWLASDKGALTLDRVIALVHNDWLAEQPAQTPAPVSPPAVETITVPNLSTPELVEDAHTAVNFTFVNPAYRTQNVVRDEGDKTYEVAYWRPGVQVTDDQVREHFDHTGFKGNTPCFISWVRKNKPYGYHASVLPKDRLVSDADGDLCSPCFGRDGAGRVLGLDDAQGPWDDDWVFVAFRELPSDPLHSVPAH